VIARGTPGFSGADLANLVNEAALFAARRNARVVEMVDFEKAKDKVMMGAERKSMVMSEEERTNTAYHESGHALVAKLVPKSDPVHKVTIIPRGRALGLTMQLPEQDRYAYDRQYLLSRIAVLTRSEKGITSSSMATMVALISEPARNATNPATVIRSMGASGRASV
jgi:cell division protease FtsH